MPATRQRTAVLAGWAVMPQFARLFTSAMAVAETAARVLRYTGAAVAGAWRTTSGAWVAGPAWGLTAASAAVIWPGSAA